MKRCMTAVLTVLLLISSAAAEPSGPPALSAQCAVLVDGESGRVLFEQNAHQKRDIASITKLMTALVAVEHAERLDEEVTIQPEWTGVEGSSIYLKPGEVITLETLLYGLLLNSGNDAAVAVAAHCAGSVEAFVARMNERAAELGMEQSHFTNPNGLSEQGHYSTAYDMALLARACSRNETISRIVATRSITKGERTFTNHNKLLWRYEGCTGMKTGYTERAGRTLVSSVQRGERTLIAVTLNAPNDWADHAALFDYGLQVYTRQVLCTRGKVVCRVPAEDSLSPFVMVVTAQDVVYTLSGAEQVQAKLTLPEYVQAPVYPGAVLGKLSFYLEDTLIGETDLLAGDTVRRNVVEHRTLVRRIMDWFGQT